MATTPEHLEQALRHDLRTLDQRLVDEKFCGELYRTLVNHTWRRRGVDDGAHLALSWKRAEELINELRGEAGEPPLALAQTGGEGFASRTALDELERLGWTGTPLNASRHDDAHLDSAADEHRTAPSDRFERAHEEAEAQRRRRIQT